MVAKAQLPLSSENEKQLARTVEEADAAVVGKCVQKLASLLGRLAAQNVTLTTSNNFGDVVK